MKTLGEQAEPGPAGGLPAPSPILLTIWRHWRPDDASPLFESTLQRLVCGAPTHTPFPLTHWSLFIEKTINGNVESQLLLVGVTKYTTHYARTQRVVLFRTTTTTIGHLPTTLRTALLSIVQLVDAGRT